ncbi:MAG: hypothetical protein HZB38_04915 [Planctomycetes bacterium]|nr:hypothetical protein [Planctomycetota bacterium]
MRTQRSVPAARLSVRRGLKKNPAAPFELHDLSVDPSEQNNIAAQHPDVVRRMNEIAAVRAKAALPEWNC